MATKEVSIGRRITPIYNIRHYKLSHAKRAAATPGVVEDTCTQNEKSKIKQFNKVCALLYNRDTSLVFVCRIEKAACDLLFIENIL